MRVGGVNYIESLSWTEYILASLIVPALACSLGGIKVMSIIELFICAQSSVFLSDNIGWFKANRISRNISIYRFSAWLCLVVAFIFFLLKITITFRSGDSTELLLLYVCIDLVIGWIIFNIFRWGWK